MKIYTKRGDKGQIEALISKRGNFLIKQGNKSNNYLNM